MARRVGRGGAAVGADRRGPGGGAWRGDLAPPVFRGLGVARPPGLRCRARTRRSGPASPRSPLRPRRRTRAGQGRAPRPRRTPTRRAPTPRRGSRDRRKSAASGPMAQGLGVRPTAGPRQAGRAGGGRRRPNGRFARRFPTPRRRHDAPLGAPSGGAEGPRGPNFRAFRMAFERAPNHVR